MNKTISICKASLFGIFIFIAIGVCGADLQLFDFESEQTHIKVLWNKEHSTAELSQQWSSQGQHSLQITAPAYDKESMSVYYYPGVEFALPTRDWSQYNYLQFDLKVEQDETPFSILIQYGKRHERISAGYNFNKGAYRIKLNLYEMIKEPAKERLASIKAFEFHVTRPKTDFTIYVDNIMLIEGSPTDAKIYDSVLSIENPQNPMPLVPPQVVSPDAGLKQLARALKKSVPGKSFGIKFTSISDQVPFCNLLFPDHWRNNFQLSMARNETRSLQAIFFRQPTDEATTFEATCEIPGLSVSLERVAYLNLPSFHRLVRNGFTPGWYPDPILEMGDSAPLAPEQWAQPLVISVTTTAESKVGNHQGTLRIFYLGEEIAVPLTVSVRNVTMPHVPSLPILLGVGTSNGEIDHDFWLRYRMNPHYSDTGNIYDRRIGKSGQDIEKLQELVAKGMTIFNLIYVNRTNFTDVSMTDYLNSIYKRYPDAYMEKLAAAGLAQRAVIYGYDEVTVSGDTHENEYNIVNEVFGALKERYGKYGVRTAATLRDCNDPAIHSLPVDIWIPLGTGIQKEAADNLVALGKEVWWYHISWEVWSPASWSRSIAWTTLHRDYSGWLYYNVNGPWSKTQTLDDSALNAWSGFSVPTLMMFGTGSLVYQNQDKIMRPSLRLLNFREGMYDYDLANNLKKQIEQLQATNKKLSRADKKTLKKAQLLFTGKDWQSISALTDEPKNKNNTIMMKIIEKKRLEMLDMQEKINEVQKRQK